MKRTLKFISALLAVVLIATMFSVSLSAYAVDEDVIGDYSFTIVDNPYENIEWGSKKLHAFKSSTHAHTVRSDADIELNDTIWYHYLKGYEMLCLTDHGTVNGVDIKHNGKVTGVTGDNGRVCGWTEDQTRCTLYGYQSFVHGNIDEISVDDYINIINGVDLNNRPANLVAAGRGMFNMPLGNECNGMSSNKCHVNTYHISFGHGANRSPSWPESTVEESYDVGGFSRINHVGEWSEGNDSASVYDADWISRYVSIFEKYCPNRDYSESDASKWEQSDYITGEKVLKGVIGMELVNTSDNRTRNDRRYVYDECLKILAPQGINMWGFCEDDSHEESDVDQNAQYFLVNDGTAESDAEVKYFGASAAHGYTGDLRYSMTNGEFYASSRNSKNSYELGDGFNAAGDYPSIDNFKIDTDKNQIVMSINRASKVRIVADGNILDTKTIKETENFATVVFDLNSYENQINNYIRIYFTGKGGITYLQPILLEKTSTPVSTVKFNVPSDDTTVKVYDDQGNLIDAKNSDRVYVLEAGNYNYIASRPGYITTEPTSFTVTQADIANAVKKEINVELEADENISFTYFYAPETIYLNTSDLNSFQYYVDRENSVEGKLNADISTSGNIYFNREGATDVSLSYKVKHYNADNNSLISDTTSSANITLSNKSANKGELAATITSGSLNSTKPTNSDSLIEWIATYNYHGQTLEAITYSYIYAPLTGYGSVAAAGGYAKTEKNIFGWAHSTMSVTGTVWLAGVHSVAGGSGAYKYAIYGGDTFVASEGVNGLLTSGSGMSIASDDSSGGSVNVYPSGSSATLNIDTSRYTNFKQIPNLAVGLDMNYAVSCDSTDDSTVQYVNFGNKSMFSLSGQAANTLSGQRYASNNSDPANCIDLAIDQSVNSINVTGQVYGYKSSRHDRVAGTVTLNLAYNNKAALRQQYNNAIKNAYQSDWFKSSASADEFLLKMRQAAITLGNPASTSTDVSETAKDIVNAISNVELKSGVATINYIDDNGNVIKTQTQPYTLGDTIIASTEDFAGYTYDDSWSYYINGKLATSGNTAFFNSMATTEECTVNFNYSANTYKVTYSASAEDYVPADGSISDIRYNEVLTVPSNKPDKEGYTFVGWYLDVTDKTYPAGSTFVWKYEQDCAFTAVYESNVYTATYNTDGGSDIGLTNVSCEFDGTFDITAEIPEKEGFAFGGWDVLTEDGTSLGIHAPGGRFTWDTVGNLELKAVWKVVTYKVTLDANGGSVTPETIDVAYAGKYDTLPVPVLTGYDFAGWYADAEFNTPVTENTYIIETNDHTLYAKWDLATFSLTYIVDGEVYSTEYYNYNESIKPLEEPVKEGYTFSGWNNVPEKMPANDTTVNGSFKVNEYTITFVLGDNESYHTMKVNYGSKISAPSVPKIEGYTFSGWNGIPSTMPAEDITIYGEYVANVHTITYYVDGEVYFTTEMTYGDVINPIDAPEKVGYTFSGWNNVPSTMPDKDVFINGLFTVNTYTVTYYVDGSVYVTMSYSYGEEIVPLAEPSKKGYNFSGWSEIPATMPNNDISVNGSFEALKYTLTYYVDDVVFDTKEYSYGETIVPLENPIKEGHTFSGWSTIPATMPSRNVTVRGIFTVNTYTYKFVLNGTEVPSWTITKEFGAAVTAPVPEYDANSAFSGWSPEVPDTMGAESLTFYGTTYKAYSEYTFDINGATGSAPETQRYQVGSTVTLPGCSGFTKTGYNFNGWAEDMNAESGFMTATVGEEDLTLYAIWQMIPVYIETKDDSTTVIDEINKLIYGLEENLDQNEFQANYVELIGESGTIEYQTGLGFGTGTKAFVKNTIDNSVVATYTLVVFGDLDGDGVADGQDVVMATALADKHLTQADVGEAVFKAADCNHDGEITSADVTEIINSGILTFDILQSK